MAAYIGNKRFQLTTALNGLGGPAKWGDITGQISAQADLQKEFQEVSALIMTEGIQQLNGIVKNGKMTIYQGNVEKGQFSANQSSDLSICLDPPSPGGGGGIPADLSCNHLSVGTSVSLGLGSTASGDYGSIAQGAYSKATANAAVALGTQCIASQQLSYAIGYKAEARHKNSMVLAMTDAYGARQSTGDNSLNIYVGNGQPSNDALNSILVNGWTLKDHIGEIIISQHMQQQLYFYPYNIENTTQNGLNIWIGQQYSNFENGIICFDVEYHGGHPFYISYTEPITYNVPVLEYYLPTNAFNDGYVGAIITLPCVFGQGVNIYNDQGSQMTVRELFRIECQPSS